MALCDISPSSGMNGSMISSEEELLFSSPTWRHVHKALSRRELLGHHPNGSGTLVCPWDQAEGKAPGAVFPSMVPQERNCQSDAEEAHQQAGCIGRQTVGQAEALGPGGLIQDFPLYWPAPWASHCPSLSLRLFIDTMRKRYSTSIFFHI